MLASDGCISNGNNRVSLKLKDQEHVKKFAQYFNTKTHETKTHQLDAYIHDVKLKSQLVKLGITPLKSKTFEYSGDLNNHFLRGYFDGDGCPGTYTKKTKCLIPKITCGSPKFIDQLEYLCKQQS